MKRKILALIVVLAFAGAVQAAMPAPDITSGDFSVGAWTNKTSGSFSFSGSDSQGAVVVSYHYAVDYDTETTLLAGTPAVLSAVPEGSHTITAYAVDDGSALSPDASVFFGVDTTAPPVPVFLWSTHTDSVESSNNNFSILFNISDSMANTTLVSGIAGLSYVLSTDPAAEVDNILETTTPATTRVDFKNVANGTRYFRARAFDAAGNSSSVYTFCVIIEYQGSILEENGVKVAPTICKDVMRVMYKLTSAANSVKIEIKEISGRTIKTASGTSASGMNTVEIPLDGVSTQSVLVKVTATRPDGKFEESYTKAIVKK